MGGGGIKQVESENAVSGKKRGKIKPLYVILLFFYIVSSCFMPAAIRDDLCPRKMWENYGAHFHDDCLPCISRRYCTSDKKRAARGGEGRIQVMHSTAIVHWALQKNIPYHCGRPYLVIQIINLTLKEKASRRRLSPPPLFHTYTQLRAQGGGRSVKRTYSLGGSYIPAMSLEHVIYIYALI